jgi:hypothetical protein
MTNSIPQTLEQARALSGIRFHAWNEEAVNLVQMILDANREVDVHGKVDPIGQSIKALAEKLDETRLIGAIATIAVKLGGKVRNFN